MAWSVEEGGAGSASPAADGVPAVDDKPAIAAPPPIRLGTRMSYGAGAIANGVKNAAFTSYLMLYFNQVIGVPAAIVGAALAATLIVDAVADPFLGRWSDVTRSRWGRRHPFIYGAILPTALFFLLTWFPPTGLSDMAMGFWIFAMAALTRISISAFEITTSAMAPEMAEDYRERTRLFSYRYWFGYAGAFGFAALSLALIFVETPAYPQGQLNPASYVNFAIFGALLIFAAILICGLGTHNRIPWLRQRDFGEDSMPVGRHFREMLESFRNRAFLAIFGFGVFKYTAIGLYSATTLYFSTYLFKLDTAQLALLTFDSLVAATLAAPLAPWFSDRIGKRASSMIFAVLGVAIGLTPLMLSYLDLFFVPGDPMLVPVLFVNGAVYGAMVAISLINTSSMLADVVEDSAVETGRHTAGTFFAASSFMQQCSNALGISAASAILAWSAFPARVDPASVTEAMTDSLLIHYIPCSFGLWAIGSLFLLFYPITKQRHARNVELLRARQAEAMSAEAQDAAVGAPAR
ncbi:MFS transporter [Sphingomonas gilva]|uniref:MFS transporter n=1 Tax=Sphingomonas gilva TaxID=2305907 RepID=A0A396RLU3_9SPHN|nr:MFS transporter [Sphingomonas gilva]RHW16576.1 MFS transporter [Sphingomonas gilva]